MEEFESEESDVELVDPELRLTEQEMAGSIPLSVEATAAALATHQRAESNQMDTYSRGQTKKKRKRTPQASTATQPIAPPATFADHSVPPASAVPTHFAPRPRLPPRLNQLPTTVTAMGFTPQTPPVLQSQTQLPPPNQGQYQANEAHIRDMVTQIVTTQLSLCYFQYCVAVTTQHLAAQLALLCGACASMGLSGFSELLSAASFRPHEELQRAAENLPESPLQLFPPTREHMIHFKEAYQEVVNSMSTTLDPIEIAQVDFLSPQIDPAALANLDLMDTVEDREPHFTLHPMPRPSSRPSSRPQTPTSRQSKSRPNTPTTSQFASQLGSALKNTPLPNFLELASSVLTSASDPASATPSASARPSSAPAAQTKPPKSQSVTFRKEVRYPASERSTRPPLTDALCLIAIEKASNLLPDKNMSEMFKKNATINQAGLAFQQGAPVQQRALAVTGIHQRAARNEVLAFVEEAFPTDPTPAYLCPHLESVHRMTEKDQLTYGVWLCAYLKHRTPVQLLHRFPETPVFAAMMGTEALKFDKILSKYKLPTKYR